MAGGAAALASAAGAAGAAAAGAAAGAAEATPIAAIFQAPSLSLRQFSALTSCSSWRNRRSGTGPAT